MPAPSTSAPSRSSVARHGVWTALGFGVVGAALVGAMAAQGCGYSSASQDQATTFHDGGDDDADAIIVDIGTDGSPSGALCGDLGPGTCNPDNAEICAPLDAGVDTGVDAPADDDAGDAVSDARSDSIGSGSKSACRVVRLLNKVTTTCAPAGLGPVSAACKGDADCAPGLACVGDPAGVFGTHCEPYCCNATDASDPCNKNDSGPRRYCLPQPVVERPGDWVPVCVRVDECTLLPDADSAGGDCQSGTTCTPVTQFGDTACVPTGSLTDLQCCSSDPWATADQRCAAGYACLGPRGDRVCRKLCRVDDTKGCGGGSHCEPQSSLPAGYGICTIDVADASVEGGCGT